MPDFSKENIMMGSPDQHQGVRNTSTKFVILNWHLLELGLKKYITTLQKKDGVVHLALTAWPNGSSALSYPHFKIILAPDRSITDEELAFIQPFFENIKGLEVKAVSSHLILQVKDTKTAIQSLMHLIDELSSVSPIRQLSGFVPAFQQGQPAASFNVVDESEQLLIAYMKALQASGNVIHFERLFEKSFVFKVLVPPHTDAFFNQLMKKEVDGTYHVLSALSTLQALGEIALKLVSSAHSKEVSTPATELATVLRLHHQFLERCLSFPLREVALLSHDKQFYHQLERFKNQSLRFLAR